MNGDLLGFGSTLVAVVAWSLWFRRMQSVSVPRDRSAFLTAMGVAVALGIVALVAGAGLFGKIGAGLGIFAGGLFLGLRLQSAQQARTPAVKVGERMLAFSAPDDAGVAFESVSLAGKPYLLKFFRGHW